MRLCLRYPGFGWRQREESKDSKKTRKRKRMSLYLSSFSDSSLSLLFPSFILLYPLFRLLHQHRRRVGTRRGGKVSGRVVDYNVLTILTLTCKHPRRIRTEEIVISHRVSTCPDISQIQYWEIHILIHSYCLILSDIVWSCLIPTVWTHRAKTLPRHRHVLGDPSWNT